MRVIEFRYQTWKDKPIPIIPIRLYSHKYSFKTWAFVDSGASYSIFGIDLLELLNLKIEQAMRKEMFIVGDGGFIPGFSNSLTIPYIMRRVKRSRNPDCMN